MTAGTTFPLEPTVESVRFAQIYAENGQSPSPEQERNIMDTIRGKSWALRLCRLLRRVACHDPTAGDSRNSISDLGVLRRRVMSACLWLETVPDIIWCSTRPHAQELGTRDGFDGGISTLTVVVTVK